MSGNVKLALSPRRARTSSTRSSRARTRCTSSATGDQVRHYTYGGDLAHGIRLAMESPAAVNDDFNLSTAASTTVLELAEAIWHKIHTDGRPFHYVSDPPFEHDVQLRVPDVRKARDVLGFEATTTARRDARRGHPVDPGGIRGRSTLMAAPGPSPVRHAGLQGGRRGRAGPPRDGRGDRRRRTRSSSSTTSTRTRPSRSSSASPPSCRRSAGCATTSAAACSTR